MDIPSKEITDHLNGTGDFNLAAAKREETDESAIPLSESSDVSARKRPEKVNSASTTSGKPSTTTQSNSFSMNNVFASSTTKRLSNFKFLMCVALLFRMVLLVFSMWQDSTRWPDGQLRFTDVDYDVFTDAARALVAGRNIYDARPTYRYSPLIAAIIAPGHWLFQRRSSNATMELASETIDPVDDRLITQPLEEGYSAVGDMLSRLWGKLIFIAADLLCACLQHKIITTELSTYKDHSEGSASERASMASSLVSLCWLFNPLTAVVSVRGNAESILGICVLGCLLLVLRRQLFFGGLVFGLCVHLKLYPVIYAPAIYLWMLYSEKKFANSLYSRVLNLLPTSGHFIFGFGTLISLGLLTTMGYVYFGGMQFLHQAYLYHFTRVDIKHNFAQHFYPFYLLSGLQWKMLDLQTVTGLINRGTTGGLLLERLSTLIGVRETSAPESWMYWVLMQGALNADLLERVFSTIATLLSLILIVGLSFKLCGQLGICWFAVTFAFVTFNKVCTSQYFLWSLVLLPIAAAQIKVPPGRSPIAATLETILMWLAPQALWLASAYTLEMRTPNSEFVARWIWLLVWTSSAIFFCFNVIILRRLIKWRIPPSGLSAKKVQ